MYKRGIVVILSVFSLLVCAIVMPVFAHPVPDMTETGKIGITMRYGDQLVPGGTLTVFRVGEIVEDNGNYGYALTGKFLQSDISLDDIQAPSLAESLAEYAASQNLTGETKEIDQNGKVIFDNLELGLYLFVQNEASEGYNRVSPFVISLPGFENGAYVYDVDGSPKMGLITEAPTTEPTTPPPTKPADPSLPQTGQLNWPIPVLVVTGLAMVIAGWAMRSDRNKEKHET